MHIFFLDIKTFCIIIVVIVITLFMYTNNNLSLQNFNL